MDEVCLYYLYETRAAEPEIGKVPLCLLHSSNRSPAVCGHSRRKPNLLALPHARFKHQRHRGTAGLGLLSQPQRAR